MPATDRHQLKQRLVQFVSSKRLAERRSLSANVIPFFSNLGSVAIIGGMPRDIAMRGSRGFRSDVDLVIQPRDYQRYLESVLAAGGERNRYGGFGLRLAGWEVDVWAIQDTWAKQANFRQVDSFRDLLKCTFFDSDAVLFELQSNEVIARRGYFQKLSRGVLGINLRENPNEKGSAVRAIRRAIGWRFRLSHSLAEYVEDVIERHGWPSLVAQDAASFGIPVLRDLDEADIRERLARILFWDGEAVTGLLSDRPRQLSFSDQNTSII